MTNPSKQRGTRWESKIVDYLGSEGFDASRKPAKGALDEGDIGVSQVGWLVIEAKNCMSMQLASWVDEAEVEAQRVHLSARGVVWHHRKGKGSPADGYVSMSGATFVEILRGLL